MSILEIISGVVLIIAAVAIIVFTMMQEPKGRGLSGVIMGGDSQAEAGRSRGCDANLAKATKIAGVVFIVVTILVGVLSAHLGA